MAKQRLCFSRFGGLLIIKKIYPRVVLGGHNEIAMMQGLGGGVFCPYPCIHIRLIIDEGYPCKSRDELLHYLEQCNYHENRYHKG